MSSSSKFKYQACFCPLFGHMKELRSRLLPTRKDIILCCLEKRRVIGKNSHGNREHKFADIADSVASECIALYEKCCIPHVSLTRVLQFINHLHKQYIKIKRS